MLNSPALNWIPERHETVAPWDKDTALYSLTAEATLEYQPRTLRVPTAPALHVLSDCNAQDPAYMRYPPSTGRSEDMYDGDIPANAFLPKNETFGPPHDLIDEGSKAENGDSQGSVQSCPGGKASGEIPIGAVSDNNGSSGSASNDITVQCLQPSFDDIETERQHSSSTKQPIVKQRASADICQREGLDALSQSSYSHQPSAIQYVLKGNPVDGKLAVNMPDVLEADMRKSMEALKLQSEADISRILRGAASSVRSIYTAHAKQEQPLKPITHVQEEEPTISPECSDVDVKEPLGRVSTGAADFCSILEQEPEGMHAALGIEEVALYSKPRCSPYGCKKESRTPHELYLQTLQEARLASQPRPRSAISTRSAATFCSHLATESLASNGKIKVRRKTRPNTAQSIPTNSPAKLKEEVSRQMLTPLPHWSSLEVGKWVDAIGLPQYRKRFIHQGITGDLLLDLTVSNLKEDLQIGVLGHRQAILAAIKVLPRQNHATLSSDQSPNHSPEPPGSPTLKAKQQRQRLLRELEKVEGHTAVLQQRLQGTSRQAELARDEACYIRGTIWDLEHRYHLPSGLQASKCQSERSMGVDKQGIVPWHPNGAPFEMTAAEIEKAEQRSLQRPAIAHRGGCSVPFLDRMKLDMKERKHRLTAMKHSLHSPERKFEDPQYSARNQKADLDLISRKLQEALDVRLVDLTGGRVKLTSMADPDSVISGTGSLKRVQEYTVAAESAINAERMATTAVALHEADGSSDGDMANDARQKSPRLHTRAVDQLSSISETLESSDVVILDSLGQENALGQNQLGIAVLGVPRAAEKALQIAPKTLSEVLDYLAFERGESLGLSSSQAESLVASLGQDRKIQLMAAAIRAADFMQRYGTDSLAREERKSKLKQYWHAAETQPPQPPEGRQRRYWKAPILPADRAAKELELCQLLFVQAGWPREDFTNDHGEAADKKLDAVLQRAEAMANGAFLKRTQGITQALPEFQDGLDELQAAYLQRMAANNPAAEPPVSTPEGPSIEALAEAPPLAGIRSSSQTTVSAIQRLASTSSSAYFAKTGRHSLLSLPEPGPREDGHDVNFTPTPATEDIPKMKQALDQVIPKENVFEDVLNGVVAQLSSCQGNERAQLMTYSGLKKQLAIYRALIMQRFLREVEMNKKKKAARAEAALKAFHLSSKVLSKKEVNAFFDRLQEDGNRRKRAREEAIKAAGDAEIAMMELARKNLAESLTQSRPGTACRKCSHSKG